MSEHRPVRQHKRVPTLHTTGIVACVLFAWLGVLTGCATTSGSYKPASADARSPLLAERLTQSALAAIDNGDDSRGEDLLIEALTADLYHGPAHNNLGWWSLFDTAGNMAALCDLDANGVARVAAQWSYEPYGDVIAAEHIHAFPVQTLGHKGLFVDRLDNSTNGPVSLGGDEAHRLVPFAHSLYHNRNRVYAPSLGRFLQQDPNQTAMALLEGSFHGSAMGSAALSYSLEGLYTDGFSLYQYLGSSPTSRFDPMGLASYDPFDMVDDYLAETAGSRAAFLSQIGQDAKAVAIVTATIASYLPFPGVGIAGDLALVALGEQSGGAAAAGVAIGIIPGGKLLKGLGKFTGSIASSAWKGAKHYASKYGAAFLKPGGKYSPLGIAGRALGFIKKGCGCFVAGTLVWTADGQLPIEHLQIGDQVVAFNEATGERELRTVIDTYVRDGAPIVEVTIATPSGQRTLRTTEEHPFFIDGRGWVDAGHLSAGDTASTEHGPSRVLGVRFTADRETVYNLEVEGLHNYFVSSDGVLVHNNVCSLRRFTYRNWTHNAQLILPKPPGAHHAHHVIPKKYVDTGLYTADELHDPRRNLAWVEPNTHYQINTLWRRWQERNPTPSREEVESFARRIDMWYGALLVKP